LKEQCKDGKKIFVGNKIDKRDLSKCDAKGGHISSETVKIIRVGY
jgi:hypothetical protein